MTKEIKINDVILQEMAEHYNRASKQLYEQGEFYEASIALLHRMVFAELYAARQILRGHGYKLKSDNAEPNN